MRIKSIRVRNFKSFKDCTINFNDFNVVIGSNASGKSNLVQIFKFLKDIEEYGLENAISLQGGVEYFINNQIGASEDFSLEIEFSYEDIISTPLINDRDTILFIEDFIYKLSVKFNVDNFDGYMVKEDKVIYKTQLGEIIENSQNMKNIRDCSFVEFLLKNNKVFYTHKSIDPNFHDTDEERLKDISNTISYLLNTNSLFSFDLESFEQISNYSGDFLLLQVYSFNFKRQFRQVFNYNFKNIGIFDFDPKLPKKATLITGKIDLEEDGSNLAIVVNKILRYPEKQRKLSNLVTDLLPFIETLKVEKFADKSLMFKLKESYAKNDEYLPAAFISDGTINIVALIVALYFSNTSFTIIEEPERNLHPSLISKVVEMMKDASRQKQTLVTTHNPEMIKYADLEDILFISRDEDGFSQITRPADSEQVKIFLENEIGMDELYLQNLLG